MASFRKRGTTWSFRVTYFDEFNNRKEITKSGFKTKPEAKYEANRIENDLKDGRNVKSSEVSFKDYFKKWYEVYKKPQVSLKTQSHYERSHIIIANYFGNTNIKDIDELKYQEFLNKFGETHAKETTEKLHSHASSCLKKAWKLGSLPYNPAEGAKIVGRASNKEERMKYLSENEVIKLKNQIGEPTTITDYLILFVLATGCRIGEALGLTWNCIDYQEKTININKSWDYQKLFDFVPTKNAASNRVITIDDKTIALLHQIHLKQKVHYKNIVFLTKVGSVPSSNAVNKRLKDHCKEAEIKIVTVHALRHTHVSLLLHHGLNQKYVSRRVGHKDVSTTLNTYSHIIDEMEQKDNNELQILMKGLL